MTPTAPRSTLVATSRRRALLAGLTGLVTLATLGGALPAHAGDLIDTRLSFPFADDNILAKSGETNPNSPNAGFGAGCQNTLFFDNFRSRYCGYESLTTIVLYKKLPAYFPGWSTEAALAIKLSPKAGAMYDLKDDSSYIRLNYRPEGWGDDENISLTGFPVSADRFRLGYAYRITWGGSGIFTSRAQSDGVPGARLQVTRSKWYAFGGAKSALALNDLILEKERLYGFLGGAGGDPTPWLHLDASGGYFQKGLVPGLATQGIAAPVNAAGGSGQVVFHWGMPVPSSVDLRLYRNDPTSPDSGLYLFPKESYPGGLSGAIIIEGSRLVQTLEDPDVFGRTAPQWADAFAVEGRLKYNFLKVTALAARRTLPFIQFEVPGLPPFKNFPTGTVLTPDQFASVGVDYHFAGPKLTPGLIAGIQMPATFKSPASLLGGNNPPPALTGERTAVVRDVNQLSVLPTGYNAVPILAAKLSLRWDISDAVVAVGESYYRRDPNQTTFRDSTAGVAEPTFDKEHAIGFVVALQARF